jgi:hypothetical protein
MLQNLESLPVRPRGLLRRNPPTVGESLSRFAERLPQLAAAREVGALLLDPNRAQGSSVTPEDPAPDFLQGAPGAVLDRAMQAVAEQSVAASQRAVLVATLGTLGKEGPPELRDALRSQLDTLPPEVASAIATRAEFEGPDDPGQKARPRSRGPRPRDLGGDNAVTRAVEEARDNRLQGLGPSPDQPERSRGTQGRQHHGRRASSAGPLGKDAQVDKTLPPRQRNKGIDPPPGGNGPDLRR